MTKLNFTIGSTPDRDDLVIDIFADGFQVAEIYQLADRSFTIEILPPPKGDAWHFDLKEFQDILNVAMSRLSDITG